MTEKKSHLVTALEGFFNPKVRYIVFSGGTSSGKTYSILQAIAVILTTKPPEKQLFSVVSKSYPHLRRGVLWDFEQIVNQSIEKGGMNIFRNFNKSTLSFDFDYFKLEFFSADKPDKVHGPKRDHLFVNEAQNIDKSTWKQLASRTKGKIFIDFNPTHYFWVHELKDMIADGLTVWHDSTYKDNPFLSELQIFEIESNRNNPNWWRVYGEGQVGALEGLIYPDFIEIDELPEDIEYVYGVDFGFSIDPTAVVKVGRNSEGWFVDEILYRTRVHTTELAEILPRGVPVYCDSAEPKTIEELVALGVSARKADKQVAAGISHVQSQRIHITRRSKNTIRELRSYAFDVDLYGNYTGVPAPRQSDHAMDAMRYAIFTHYRNKLNSKLFAPKPQRIYR